MSARTHDAEKCAYVVGKDGLARWPDVHAGAWLGLLQAYRQLIRDLDTALESRHGLSLSGLELLGRLATADERSLRLTALAEQTRLSLSRVSRIADALEQRGLVERHACAEDARAINLWLTDAGLQLTREAQASHFADVQRRFFDQLDAGELRMLANVFARLAPQAAPSAQSKVETHARPGKTTRSRRHKSHSTGLFE